MDFDGIERLIPAFESHGVRYAIFGDTALDLHARPAYKDVDVLLAPDRDNVGRLKSACARAVAPAPGG